jgi:hypothetical protein
MASAADKLKHTPAHDARPTRRDRNVHTKAAAQSPSSALAIADGGASTSITAQAAASSRRRLFIFNFY